MSANVIYITSMGCQILRETQHKTSIWNPFTSAYWIDLHEQVDEQNKNGHTTYARK